MEFLIGLFCGAVIVGMLILAALNIIAKSRLKQVEETLEKTLKNLKDRIINSRIEEVNGYLFLYNRDTNEFLGQGKDLKELNDVVMKRYPDKLFNVPQEELSKYQEALKNA